MSVQFEHLKYFRAVADHRSITRAAAALFCAQPTISNAIRNIETELGYPIIERSTTGVNLTDLGRRLYDDAGIVLDTYQRWLDMAEESSLYHPVTITMTGTAPSFSKSFPTSPSISSSNTSPTLWRRRSADVFQFNTKFPTT